MAESVEPPIDPQTLIGSRAYMRLLLLSAVAGLAASLVAWSFLTATPWIQERVFEDLPDLLGFDTPPRWWPVPVLAVAGLVTALTISRLPGRGGSVPAEGLGSGPPTQYIDLPGVILAGLTTLGLGLVLGPSGPVIAIGAGLGALVVRLAMKDAPNQVLMIMSAAGSCASFAMVFRSPLLSAIVILEAIGVSGALEKVVLLPCLIGAGVGSITYLGLGQIPGLSVDSYALYPLHLTDMGALHPAQIAWAIPLAIAAGALGFAVTTGGRWVHKVVAPRLLALLPVVGIAVALLAILFARTGESYDAVLFSGSKALAPLVDNAATISVWTLIWLLVLKGLAWTMSMGAFRGGAVFPAIFLGTVGGVLADHLPGLNQGAAISIVLAAAIVAILRLPLSSVVIATALTSGAGAASATLIVISVVIAYVTVDKLLDRGRAGSEQAATGALAADE